MIELRRKLGNAVAFVHSDRVSEALRIARHRPGAMERVRRDAAEAFATVSVGAFSVNSVAPSAAVLAARIGPKGGVPRAKAELQQLSCTCGL